ncbi:MAG: aldo/keto reductase [Halanaerobiales bacterium]|nr:aldo/keto reductase [Halanaerobiales bacterium]
MEKKGLGVGIYSLAGVYGRKDLNEIKKMLLHAVESGVNYFDVADHYGPAEEIIGTTLKSYRSQIKIATKVGLTEKGGQNCSYDHIVDSCQKSLKRLQTDYIDLYQIHFDDPKTPVEETLKALEDLKDKGMILEYGLGHLPVHRLEEYVMKGNPKTLMIELSPVALKRYQELYPICDKYNIGIITHGTTGRGLLTGNLKADHKFASDDIRNIDPLFQHGYYKSAIKVLERLIELGKKYNKSSVQVALNWVLNQPGIERVLVGPSTIEHLDEDLGALEWRLKEVDLENLTDFVLKEDRIKGNNLETEIFEILKNDLPKDRNQAVADLIYVIDGLIELKKVEAKELFPFFGELLAWKRENNKKWALVRDIKEQISELIKKEICVF